VKELDRRLLLNTRGAASWAAGIRALDWDCCGQHGCGESVERLTRGMTVGGKGARRKSCAVFTEDEGALSTRAVCKIDCHF
jgi:hypothetical protein